MNRRSINVALTAVALLLTASIAFAVEEDATQPLNNKPAKSVKKSTAAKKTSTIMLVDVNSASKEALKKLPGITDTYADKIIAGRPYPTKVRIQTSNILPAEVYAGISKKIIAKQPFKDSAKNAAIYSKKP